MWRSMISRAGGSFCRGATAADVAGACAAELVPGAWIQPASRLAAEPAATYDAMGRVLDDLLQSLVGSGVRS